MSSLARPLKWPPVFPLEKGLVLHLPFDDRSGSKAYDRSMKGNNGTLYGPSWVAGRRDSALSFDGADDYVRVEDAPSLRLTDALTLMAWIKILSYKSYGMVVTKAAAGNLNGYQLGTYDTTDKLRVVIGTSTVAVELVGLVGIPLSVWTHVSFTYDRVNLKCYVNGVLDNSTPGTGAIGVNIANYVAVGRRMDGYFANMDINEVRIYSRALTAAEIKRLFESEILLARH